MPRNKAQEEAEVGEGMKQLDPSDFQKGYCPYGTDSPIGQGKPRFLLFCLNWCLEQGPVCLKGEMLEAKGKKRIRESMVQGHIIVKAKLSTSAVEHLFCGGQEAGEEEPFKDFTMRTQRQKNEIS